MRVALAVWKLFPSFIGGTERHSLHLARALGRLGAEVDVLCAEVPAGLSLDREPFGVVPVGWRKGIPDLVASWFFALRVSEVIAHGGYDVAYGQNLALWAYVKRRDRVPCVTNLHGLEPFKVRGPVARSRGVFRRQALRVTARHSDVLVSLGGKLTSELISLLHVESERIAVLPAGVDLPALDSGRQQLRQTARTPHTYLAVGRLAPNKGMDLLIKAFRMLGDSCPARLFVVGNGPLRSQLERKAPRSVTFLGSLSDQELVRWYLKAEVFVLPSLFEGMPGVILEGMAMGLPILATDIGAVATMVAEDNGLVVEPGSAEALLHGIRYFEALPPESRGAMGRRSREKVEAQYSWDAVGQRTIELLASLASARPIRQ